MGAKKGAGDGPNPSRDRRKAIARARSDGRRRGLLWIGAAVVVSAAVLALVIINVMKSGGHRTSATTAADLNKPPASVAVGADTMPPWPAPSDASAAVAAAGLPMMGAEGQVEHIHAHLDVLVHSRAVQVPAGIGIDRQRSTISPLHTHDDTGVNHIEAPRTDNSASASSSPNGG